MKWVFDNSTKLAGLFSLALIVFTIAHDWGYFIVIGPKFRSIQTAYDYIASAIEWLPGFLAVILPATLISFLVLKLPALNVPDEFGFEGQRKAPPNWPVRIIESAILIFPILFLLLSLPFSYPSNLVALAAAGFFALMNVVYFTIRGSLWVHVMGVVTVVILVFCSGIADGIISTRGTLDAHRLKLKGGESIHVSLLRSFEKGVLVWNPLQERVQFIRWDQAEELSHRIELNGPASGCRFLTWFCRNRIEP
jgi:hypothetical protein